MSPAPHQSTPCTPICRLDTKYKVCWSRDIVGQKSSTSEFTSSPAFTGSPHGASSLARVEIQMSSPPCPPGARLEAMKKVLPSGAMKGQPSVAEVLKFGCA